jgi:hypothetical protein
MTALLTPGYRGLAGVSREASYIFSFFFKATGHSRPNLRTLRLSFRFVSG